MGFGGSAGIAPHRAARLAVFAGTPGADMTWDETSFGRAGSRGNSAADATGPAEAETLLTKARALLERGHHAVAAAMFRRFAASDPERPDGWIGQADAALAEGRPSVAIAACEQGLKTCPDNQGLVLKRALGLQRVGRPMEAIGLLKAQVQRHPKRVVFRNELARAHAAAGETLVARTIYERVISEMP